MNEFINTLSQPWPWYVAGPIIGSIMFLLLLFGNSLGISSNLRTLCSIVGAGKSCEFFDFDWKRQLWNLVFALGMVIGGVISQFFLTEDSSAHISDETIHELKAMGIENAGASYVPEEIFSWDALSSPTSLIFIIIGGFLVGFGTRYAGGCTSGHAISGLSDLQLPSLIAVMGFFIGGLFITYLILPHILTLN